MQEYLLEEFEDRSVERPRNVRIAVILLIASIAIGILNYFLTILTVHFVVSITGLSLVLIFSILIMGFLVYQINIGKNWARNLFFILVVIGIISIPRAIITMFNVDLFLAIVMLVQTILQLSAVVLLVTKPSNVWFRVKK